MACNEELATEYEELVKAEIEAEQELYELQKQIQAMEDNDQ